MAYSPPYHRGVANMKGGLLNENKEKPPQLRSGSPKEMLSFVKEEQISLLLNIIIAYLNVRLVSIFEEILLKTL